MTISKTRMALLVVGCLLFILFAATATAPLQAQTTDDIWSTPENISQSGAATNLVVTTDNSGQIVLLWRDALAGFMVTQGDGTDWATPQNVRLPFSDPPFGSFDDLDFTLFTPALVIDDTQQVHSFWRNEENELVYSQVALADLAIQEAWSVPFVLAESANSFDVALDATGKLHVVMLQAQNTAEVPAGIYYRYSEDGGLNWAETVNLYESDYLRTVSSEQIGLKLVTNDDEQILVGWDNPALEAVYVIRSPNGGVGWTAPLVVDQREVEDSVDALGPSGIDVAFNGAEAHVTWRASHGNEECAQYHQVSTDGGETWQPAAVISSELACPTEAQLLVDKNGVVFLLATAAGQAYLLAWDGLMWSEPELQTAVPNFLNPTTNRLVTDSCAYPIVGDENHLLIFGCGISSNSALKVEDVWVRERPLGSLEDWFVSDNVVWSNPVAVSTDQDELETPIILTDAAGLFHAFWLGSNPISNAVTPTAIFYTYWNGTFWSRPTSILEVTADEMDVVADINGNFLVVWRDPTQNAFFLTHVDQELAAFQAEWSAPQPLPVIQGTVSSPNILVGTENKIYVTYVVPLNESRGIYVIDSQNMGLTWSDPTTVFDAAASGWSMVGRVQMTQTQNGDFHALWQQLELPVGREPLALFYANSQDNGRSWSTPDRVAEKPAQWSRLVSDGSQMIFRFWQEASQGRVGLWYQRSGDRGQVWSEPELVFGFGDFSQATDVVADQAGQLHLLKMVDTDIEQPLLREWLWQGTNWITENEATFSSPSLVGIETKLAAMIGDNGRLGILYSRAASVPFTLDAAFSLHYVERLFTLPENAIIIPSPTAVSTSTAPAPTETPTPQPSATERPIFSTDGLPTPTNSISDSPVGSIIVGLLPAGLIVIGVVIFSLYFSRLRKNL